MTDPRLDGLPEEVIENASKAHCSRCGEQIIAQRTMAGTVMVNYTVPAMGYRHRTFLCSGCGLAFREFMHPEVQDDPRFQAAARLIRENWL